MPMDLCIVIHAVHADSVASAAGPGIAVRIPPLFCVCLEWSAFAMLHGFPPGSIVSFYSPRL